MWSSTRSPGAKRRALVALLLALPLAAAAAPPVPVRKYLDQAQRVGAGALTWFGFPIYEAVLYAPASFDLRQPYSRPFVLELTYARNLTGAAIAEASRDEIERLGLGSGVQRAAWHAQMRQLFPDVGAGHRLAGVFQPDAGARFYYNDRFIGAIADRDFARAFFAIWFDEQTRAPRLREDLLKARAAERPRS